MNAITSRFTSRKIPITVEGTQHLDKQFTPLESRIILKTKKKLLLFDDDEKSAFQDASASQISFRVQKISHNQYLKKKPLFTGKEETHSLITRKRKKVTRSAERQSAHTRA